MYNKNQKVRFSLISGYDTDKKQHLYTYYECEVVEVGSLKRKDEIFKFVPSTGRAQKEGHFIVTSKNQIGINCKKHDSVPNVAKRNKKITINPKNYEKLVLKVLNSYPY